MKVNVIYDLTDESDKYDFDMMLKVHELKEVYDQLYQYQRNLSKYEERETIPAREVVERLREIMCFYSGE